MIDFSSLVSAIHGSVQTAANMLARENQESLLRYFVDPGEPVDARKILQDALRDATAASSAGSPEEVIRLLNAALQSVTAANDAPRTALQPKTVAIDYPMMTSNGPTVHTVHVPLITLVPFVATQVSKLVFKTNLELQASSEGKLQVSFPSSGSSGAPPPSRGEEHGEPSPKGEGTPAGTLSASLEIVVEATPPPDGLRKLIEGYERALRAQIPG